MVLEYKKPGKDANPTEKPIMSYLGLANISRLMAKQSRKKCPQKRCERKVYRPIMEALEDRVVLSPLIIEYGSTPPIYNTSGIISGPDGNIWFADYGSIGKLNPNTGNIE